MGKGWSIFFGAVLLACFLSLAIAPFVGWWLPKNVASFGGEIDFLFYVILFFTGFFFVLTEALLVYFMWKFAYDPARKATYIEGNHKLEWAWTIIPAAILLYIAFAQIPAWAKMKSAEPTSWFVYGNYKVNGEPPDQVVQVTARQWDWKMRYPTPTNVLASSTARAWAESPQIDDIYSMAELHTWKGASVRVYLQTHDVIHSFFMPHFRLKQDALPGKTIPIWFKPIESNVEPGTWKLKEEWELTCAELCGARHYAMRGQIIVHESKADYLKWLEQAQKNQTAPKDESR